MTTTSSSLTPTAPRTSDRAESARTLPSEGSSPALAAPWLGIALVLCVACALCTPLTYFRHDVAHCWTLWSIATQGDTPWRAYQTNADCNYPSFMLYLFTLIERIRLAVHSHPVSPLMLTLFKLPGILCIAAGAALCWYGLRARLGSRYAATAATAYALSVALWFNSAAWGQFDAILCLGMVGAVIALINDRPGWCGAAIGLALTVKFQAVIIVPVLGIYWLRRGGWRAALTVAGAALAAWAVVSAPFFLGGGGRGLMASYTAAVGYFPFLKVNGWNIWALVEHLDGTVFHFSSPDSDATKLLRLITIKQVGLLMFAAYTLFILYGLWRRPTRYAGAFACAMAAFAFYMLPTEIHERYIVPAVALTILLVPALPGSGTRSAIPALFIGLDIMATLGQLVNCQFNYNAATAHVGYIQNQLLTKDHVEIGGSLANCVLFVWGSILYYRQVYLARPDAPDLMAPAANPAT